MTSNLNTTEYNKVIQTGKKVHTWLGWGVIIKIYDYGTSGKRFIVKYENGSTEVFHENQLSLD